MTAREALRRHWPEYLMEAAGLGTFMVSACAFAVWLGHPASVLHSALPGPLARRSVAGVAMGLTAIAIIYSPWGRRSGAHLNPAVTLAFWRLGRIPRHDAIFYAAAQFAGGALGVLFASAVFGGRLAHPAARFAITMPGPAGIAAAFVAEAVIAFALITVVLHVSASRFERFTGLCAGALIALYILLEEPFSGMSMNPARSLASALPAGDLRSLWIYFIAPPLAMFVAASLYARRKATGCAKLFHARDQRCIFCEQRPRSAGRQRIVVLGGGFGGVYVAQRLEKLFGGKGDYEIVLVSKENYFVFQPMLPEVISGSIGLTDLVCPLRRLLPMTEVHVREVESVDLRRRVVVTAPGFQPHAHEIPFDHLVIALGNVTDFRGLRGLPEHALPFKNLQDALDLRNHVIRTLDEAAIEAHDMRLRKQLLTFVVAGGGFSGVEVVAELNDMVRHVATHYPSIDPSQIRVTLVHSQDRILPEVDEQLALYAQDLLRKRGVEILLNTKLSAASGEEAILADGMRIPTRTLVSTVPSFPHPLLENLNLPKARGGRIQVSSELEVPGVPGVWALGDCAAVPAPDGTASPPTAQHAIRQAHTVADNIVATIRGERRRRFSFAGLGKMGALGRRSAVADVLGVKLSGALAWFLWRTVYLLKLPGWGRRFKVAAAWTFDLFLDPDLVLFRFGARSAVLREHFEPGQEVFHQGDIGNRIYSIVSGAAEAVHEIDGRETVLARLGAGDIFGAIEVLDGTTRSASIRCVEPMDVWSLPKHDLELLSSGIPEVRRTLEALREPRARKVS
ncbi:MAG TPA: FAD-dependent oxidoreductase [Myxococcales bacterium]|nr:FAD-dependent oxidoreductase [Myxococcales bacterium]